MRLDIIHLRDPDYACDHEIFVDGVKVEDVHIHEFDPGAGYSMAQFEDNRIGHLKNAPDFLKPRIDEIYSEMDTAYRKWAL